MPIINEFTAHFSMAAMQRAAGSYARGVIGGGSLMGKISRGSLRNTAGMMGHMGGGGLMAGSMGNLTGGSRMLLARNSMLRGAAINAGGGALAGAAYDNNDRMGGAFRGAMLGAGLGVGGRLGMAGAMRYGAANPEFGAALRSGLGRYGSMRGGMNRMGRRVN